MKQTGEKALFVASAVCSYLNQCSTEPSVDLILSHVQDLLLIHMIIRLIVKLSCNLWLQRVSLRSVIFFFFLSQQSALKVLTLSVFNFCIAPINLQLDMPLTCQHVYQLIKIDSSIALSFRHTSLFMTGWVTECFYCPCNVCNYIIEEERYVITTSAGERSCRKTRRCWKAERNMAGISLMKRSIWPLVTCLSPHLKE